MNADFRKASESRQNFALKGYTLIELLIVMVILSLLAGLLIPQWYQVVDRNRVRATKGIADQIRAAMEVYKFNYTQYPDSIADTDDLYNKLGSQFSFDFRKELSPDKVVVYTTSGAPPSDYSLSVKANVPASTPVTITVSPRALTVDCAGEAICRGL